MKKGLACRLGDIDSDVETRDGEVLRNDAAPNLVQQLMHRIAFLAVDIEIAGHVPPRQIEQMQGRDRRRIAHGKAKRVRARKPGLEEQQKMQTGINKPAMFRNILNPGGGL